MKRLLLFIAVVLLLPSMAVADIIIFATGSAKEGIIEEETPTTVRIRIKNKIVGISRDNIERIEYATPEENQALIVKWRTEIQEQEERRRRKQEERERFEREQAAKGLEKVGDQWITPAQKERMRQQAIQQQVEQERTAEIAAQQQAEEQETSSLPAFVQKLSEAEREQYLRDMKKIRVTDVRAVPDGMNKTIVRAVVANQGEFEAEEILLDVEVRSAEDELVYADTESVRLVEAGSSRNVDIVIRANSEFVKRLKVTAIGVTWR